MKLNSIVFHTHALPAIREFYEGLMELPTGTIVREGKTHADCSIDYVNYYLPSVTLCFRFDENRIDGGTLILHSDDMKALAARLASGGVDVKTGKDHFSVHDPDGRTVIIEPAVAAKNVDTTAPLACEV